MLTQTETPEFGTLRLDERLLRSIHEMGFTAPTPIQLKAIPLVLQGSDLIGQAQTGTGKTAAFGLPILQNLQADKRVIQALILVPTRELALQVTEEIKTLGKHTHARVLSVYGGQDIEKQLGPLSEGVQIVVGTPGRILDHLERGSLRLQTVRIVVLDEADRMLDMGFIDDVRHILEKTPRDRQTLLFSATMPGPVRELAEKFMVQPELIKVSEDKLTVEGINQYYIGIDPRDKIDMLHAILKTRAQTLTIVFCRTKFGADKLANILADRGFRAMPLHGNLTQSARDRVMKQFRDGEIQVLVATDLASRGLDVEDVTHVINYDLPEDGNIYVHRIGRTGRAGKEGEAITFCGNLLDIRQVKLWAQMAGSTTEELRIEFQKHPRPQGAGHGAPYRGPQRHGGHGGYRPGPRGQGFRQGGRPPHRRHEGPHNRSFRR